MRGAPELQRSSDASHNRENARRLWEISEELTGVTYEFDRSLGAQAGGFASDLAARLSEKRS